MSTVRVEIVPPIERDVQITVPYRIAQGILALAGAIDGDGREHFFGHRTDNPLYYALKTANIEPLHARGNLRLVKF
jgi:hypothetical protein